ncbi:hypothetical protein AVEN_166373-1 [Araneus ventricosus]|uniref:Uncharacterized protein n=1 Tax=Araneus ventricosus TaxID=182803 RepID=A0A4Y2SNW7_ARAVE|nr:hypothetical protein AVEN_166373-1 [Araneus ventricosus]
MAVQRQRETSEESLARLQANAEMMAVRRQRETSEERKGRLQANAKRNTEQGQGASASNAVKWSLSAYKYNSNCAYESESVVNMGSISCFFFAHFGVRKSGIVNHLAYDAATEKCNCL